MEITRDTLRTLRPAFNPDGLWVVSHVVRGEAAEIMSFVDCVAAQAFARALAAYSGPHDHYSVKRMAWGAV